MASNFRNISEDEKMRSNYAEYLVKRSSPRLLLAKCGIILFAIVVVLLAFALVLRWVAAAMLPIFIGTMALCWFLWRFTNVEYEYIIVSATVEIHRILGERSRSKIFEIKTSDIEKVAPLSSHPEISGQKFVEVTDITSGKAKDETYFVLYNCDGGKGIIYLNVIKKTLDVFKYYRASAVEYGNIQ